MDRSTFEPIAAPTMQEVPSRHSPNWLGKTKRVMAVGGLAVASLFMARGTPPAGGESQPLPKVETSATAYLPIEASAMGQINQLTNWIDQLKLQKYIDALNLNTFLDSIKAGSANSKYYQSQQPVYSTSEPGEFLACVRQRESGGDYTIHELTGASDAAGAYQFLPSTWNAIAEATGRSDLEGIDPAAASPADQDAMAQELYAQQGAAPWGGSCS